PRRHRVHRRGAEDERRQVRQEGSAGGLQVLRASTLTPWARELRDSRAIGYFGSDASRPRTVRRPNKAPAANSAAPLATLRAAAPDPFGSWAGTPFVRVRSSGGAGPRFGAAAGPSNATPTSSSGRCSCASAARV